MTGTDGGGLVFVEAGFVEPMLLLRTDRRPEGPEWAYEIKLDGYHALAFKKAGKVISAPGTIMTSMRGIPAS
jgi:hypothetical protein